jgi:hypothetical protein
MVSFSPFFRAGEENISEFPTPWQRIRSAGYLLLQQVLRANLATPHKWLIMAGLFARPNRLYRTSKIFRSPLGFAKKPYPERTMFSRERRMDDYGRYSIPIPSNPPLAALIENFDSFFAKRLPQS